MLRRLFPLLLLAAALAGTLFFAIHAWQILRYPYPLDYGEGPLLAQVNALRAGTPLWRLYADPDAPRYFVVNYPPVFHLATLALTLIAGNTLLAGRLVSLLATLGTVAALGWLVADRRRPTPAARRPPPDNPRGAGRLGWGMGRLGEAFAAGGFGRDVGLVVANASPLLVLAVPIVREWAVLLRVDALGVCLGLWGLALALRTRTRRGLALAALLLALSLLTKPSLIAAPAAALLTLLLRDRRRGLALALWLAAFGGAALAALQLLSGWFWFHTVIANANAFDWALARGFWLAQLTIHWPLFLAAILSVAILGWRDRKQQYPQWMRQQAFVPALIYALFGAATAAGIGKVGAYLNYFLELYVGLFWLIALGVKVLLLPPERASASTSSASASGAPERASASAGSANGAAAERASASAGSANGAAAERASASTSSASASGPPSGVAARAPEPQRGAAPERASASAGSASASGALLLLIALTLGGLLRFYPLWSPDYLKPYGLIERTAPPRFIFGSYGIWQDLRRERAVLRTLGQVNAALVAEVSASGGPIFTDLPGVAAQAGVLARHQVFEHRVLADAGRWDQTGLLLDLANGALPLGVVDYLGNWMTPEMIAVLTHRYAQDGSRGTVDLYRPLAIGAAVGPEQPASPALRVTPHLAPPLTGGLEYQPNDTALLTLVWRRTAADVAAQPVTVELRDASGAQRAGWTAPLLYGALPPERWPLNAPVQDLRPLRLPADLAAGEYTLALALGDAQPLPLGTLRVSGPPSRSWGRFDYAVPDALLRGWEQLGGAALLGNPQMPAVPLADGAQQCFANGCLRLQDGVVARLPLGELVAVGDGGWRPSEDGAVAPELQAFWQAGGGERAFGPVVSAPFGRGAGVAQYFRYARLEQQAGGTVRAAPLGVEYLRLPNGGPYRLKVER